MGYRPEDPKVVYQRLWILLAKWRQTVEMAVPAQHRREIVPATEDTDAPEGRRKRKNRARQ